MMDIVALQKKILEIALYLDALCRQHKITYYLASGSVLGAIRHQGFIPWDDDLDVFMTRDNYLKLIEICKKHLDPERFYLQEEDTEEWPLFFTKLRMNGTSYQEEDTKDRKMHHGIFVDIFCLNNVSENYVFHFGQYISAKLLIASALGRRGYKTKSLLKKSTIFLADIFVRGSIKKGLLRFVRGFNHQETRQVANFWGKTRFRNTSFPSSYLGEPRYVQFSDAMLPVPSQADKYLAIRYGDYMKIPDMKTQELAAHAVHVDLEKSQ